MCGNIGSGAQLLGIQSKADGSLDTWSEGLGVAEREQANIVDLSLDERRRVEVSVNVF